MRFIQELFSVETCTAVADFMESVKMLTLEMFNAGMVREAAKMAEYGVRQALRLGLLYRWNIYLFIQGIRMIVHTV